MRTNIPGTYTVSVESTVMSVVSSGVVIMVMTEHCIWVGVTPASYLGGPRFKSQLED